MNSSISPAVQKVKDALEEKGFFLEVVVLDRSARTSKEAAEAIGCKVAQIVKSLVFCTKKGKQPILVLASGANRVQEEVVSGLLGEEIEKADADFVRHHTGFAIGGVPPCGHLQSMKTFIDNDLFNYEEVWAAAGTPHAVFCLSPADLLSLSSGEKVKIK